jgi:hypothetical protein
VNFDCIWKERVTWDRQWDLEVSRRNWFCSCRRITQEEGKCLKKSKPKFQITRHARFPCIETTLPVNRFFVGSLSMISRSYSVGWWDGWWVGKDLEGSDYGLNEVLSRNFLRDTEENHGNLSHDTRWSSRNSNTDPECKSRTLKQDQLVRTSVSMFFLSLMDD